MARIVLYLGMQEQSALCKLAEFEYRDPRAQAALIIRDELTRRGLLSQEQPTTPTHPMQALDPAQGN